MRRIISVLLVAVLLLSLASCGTGDGPKYTETYLKYFNTVTTISCFGNMSRSEFDRISDKAEQLLEKYHRLYDIYFEYSGINNIKTVNDNAGIRPVEVDPAIIDLLEFSIEAHELTGGEVNIAMGSVLKLWHDARTGASSGSPRLPDTAKLEAAAEHTDIEKIVIDREAGTVYLDDPDMSLDVGATAKGYATERVAEMLISEGVTGIALNVGGNIRVIGGKPTLTGVAPFTVGITHPDSDADGFIATVEITDTSLVTSGDYERYFMLDGVRYHHIIDGDTLMPARYFTSVSIITEDSGLADALSTALFTLDYESGLALVRSLDGVEAMWVTPDYTVYYSDGFPH